MLPFETFTPGQRSTGHLLALKAKLQSMQLLVLPHVDDIASSLAFVLLAWSVFVCVSVI